MTPSDIFARVVALVAGTILARHRGQGELPQAAGASRRSRRPRPQGIPTLKMPTARGWRAGQTPVAAAGLKVNAFATGLKHPRWMLVLPNGDVLAAEALTLAGGRQLALRLRHRHHDAARGGARREPEPDHPAARRRRRRRRRVRATPCSTA